MIKNYSKKSQKAQGFTLLLAIVISSITLAIGLTLSVIAFKELTLASTFRDSMLAFYAAESGSECGRYWGTRQDKTIFSDDQTAPIYCNGNTFNLNSGITRSTDPATGYPVFKFEYTIDNLYKAKVTVVRKPGIRVEDISAEGYNSTLSVVNDKTLQRYRLINIAGLCSLRPDIMFALDHSGSIDSAAYDLYIASLTPYINSFNTQNNKVRLGVVRWSREAELSAHLTDDKALVVDGAKRPYPNVCTYGCSGNTNMTEGLMKARYELSNLTLNGNPRGSWGTVYDSDARLSSSKYMILITDGTPDDFTLADGKIIGNTGNPATVNYPGTCVSTADLDTAAVCSHPIEQANLAKQSGVDIFVIGVGNPNFINDNLLGNGIAGDSSDTDNTTPAPDYYFRIDDFSQLEKILNSIRFCVKPILEK